MAISELYTGSEAISTTEHSLTTDTSGPDADTTDGVIQCFLDLSDMVAGDELQIRCYEKVTSGGTQRVLEEWSFFGAQSKPHFATPALILLHGWDFTADAIAGTITLNWSIRTVA